MNIRVKTLGSVVCLVALAWLLLHVASMLLVQPRLENLESHATEQYVRQTVTALQKDVDELHKTTTDWASWDDTYDFMKTHDAEYVDVNLTDDAVRVLGVNFVLFVDTDGNVAYSKAVGDGEEELAMPQDLLAAFRGGSQLVSRDETTDHKGYLVLKSGQVAFAARPILTSDATGPVGGTLVFAKYFSGSSEHMGAEDSRTTYYAAASSDLPEDVSAVRVALAAGKPVTRVLSKERAAGYQVLKDAYGQPSLILKVDVTRDMFQEAEHSLAVYLVAAVVIFCLLAIINGVSIARVVEKNQVIAFKDDFFHVASHELRTPLTAIRSNSQMIKEMYTKSDPNLKEMVSDIHESSVRLIRIVNNFLDAARFERGKVPFALTTFDLGGSIHGVVNELQGVARDKNLYIHTFLPEHLPLVYADKDRVEQIVYNIVGNALKYTDEGGVELHVREETGRVIVAVSDTGRGIPKEAQKNLFRKFQQTKRGDAAKGSGLGLYITKMLAENMGGAVWIDSSEEGAGTTMSVSFPIAKEQTKQS